MESVVATTYSMCRVCEYCNRTNHRAHRYDCYPCRCSLIEVGRFPISFLLTSPHYLHKNTSYSTVITRQQYHLSCRTTLAMGRSRLSAASLALCLVAIATKLSISVDAFHMPTTSLSSSSSLRSESALSMKWRGTEDVEGVDILKSCFPYLLPLCDGDHFGRFVYQSVPPLGFLDSLFIAPLSEFVTGIPLLSPIIFVTLTLGTRSNTEMSWNVRFNAQQAALLDVALVFPELIGSAFEGQDIPRDLQAPCMNFVWYCYMAAVLYSIYSNVILRKRPDQIPWISAYASAMTGPI